jgi:hypothetical protein
MALSVIALGFLYYKGMITLPSLPIPKLHVIGDVDSVQYITVQVGPTEFYKVAVDSSCKLEYTNEENIWKFDKVIIMRTIVPVNGYHYDGNAYYKRDTEVYTKVNDYYIVALSGDKLLSGTVDYMCDETTYEIEASLNKKSQTKNKWSAASVVGFKVLDNNVIVPKDYKSSLIPNADSISYFTKDGYFCSYITYFTYEEEKQALVSKLIALQNKSITEYYDDGKVFIARINDSYVGIRNINYNTQLVVTGKGNDVYDFIIATLYGLDS